MRFPGDDFPSEDVAQHLTGRKNVGRASIHHVPSGASPTAGDDTMHVPVMMQALSPGVQYHQSAKMLRLSRRTGKLLVGFLLTVSIGYMVIGFSPTQSPVNPLRGAWQLNLARTRYGTSAERRLQEAFVCEGPDHDLRCRIEGTRADGRHVRAEFSAALDGHARAVTGVGDIDQVSLRSAVDGIVDATFSYRDTPVIGYRIYQSEDGKSLTIVSVAPVSRVALSTVVVYDRQEAADR